MSLIILAFDLAIKNYSEKSTVALGVLVRQPGTIRYGEVSRVVTVNPQGWTKFLPYLSQMDEEIILLQETFLAAGSIRSADIDAKACGYHAFFVPAVKAKRGRPQGGLGVLSKVATPAAVPHGGELYDKGRWT
eukprot:4419460-Amphidinium_carterae.1